MAEEKKIRVDKLASVTVNLQLEKEIEITEKLTARAGNVCVVRALEEKRVYDRLELVTGRMAKISKGDIIAGALGERRALQGFAGVVPKDVKKGDVLHVLNIGGIIGKAVSFSRDYGQPLKVEVLGMAVKGGRILNIRDGAYAVARALDRSVPLVVVCGTSMNSGKTEALARIIQVLAWNGMRVCAAKATGISALKDTLNMEDHGAVEALSFIDFGYPSTVGIKEVPLIAKGIINELARIEPEAIMIELGDGLLGEYGVRDFFQDDELRSCIACTIACAIDPVGAWGMKEIMQKDGIPIHVVSGPVTDNTVGIDFLKKTLGLVGLNALSQQEELGAYVERKISEAKTGAARE
jgi:hypothetical protein